MTSPARHGVFHVNQPTRVVAGVGAVEGVGRYASAYGVRALLVVGDSHARDSGLLTRVLAALRQEGIEVELLEGVPTNPGVAVVDAGAQLARAWRADMVVAVGGGSVLDAAKAMSTLAMTPSSQSFREHLSGIRRRDLLVDSALPLVAVPTLMGAGSETNGTSVITDDETGRKLSAHSELAAPRVAIIDPELVASAPLELLGPGLVDAACHAIEAGLSTNASVASDAAAEQALRMLVRTAPSIAAPAEDAHGSGAHLDALLELWWATNLAGHALTLAGSIVTHPLAHPLSARLDVSHGAAVAALEPAVIAVLCERFHEAGSLEKVASWLGVRAAAEHAGAVRGILTRLAKLCSALDVRASAADLGVDDTMVELVVRDARASGSRGLANVPGGEPGADDLLRILDLARVHGPTASPKSMLAAV